MDIRDLDAALRALFDLSENPASLPVDAVAGRTFCHRIVERYGAPHNFIAAALRHGRAG